MQNSLRLLPSGPDRVGEVRCPQPTPHLFISRLAWLRKVAAAGPKWQFSAMRRINPSGPNVYAGGNLDRAAELRENTGWQEAALDDPDSRFVLFHEGNPLMQTRPEQAPRILFSPRPAAHGAAVFIGLHEGAPLFAASVDAPTDSHADGRADGHADGHADLRRLRGALTAAEASIVATARAMLYWQTQTAFCGRCGGATKPTRGGYVMQCGHCGAEHFPRSDPAVIMLVVKGQRLLLGQSLKFPPERNFYSTLAGFVEPGESLEDAVRREVFEEVGVKIGEVCYHSSQPWPFPASQMIGFYAEALTETIVLEPKEMRDARWFTAEDIINREALGFDLPPIDSIARRLIDDWLLQSGSVT